MNLSLNNWLLLFFMLLFTLQGATAAVLSVCTLENAHYHSTQAEHDSSEHHSDSQNKSNENDQDYLLTSLPCDDFSCDAFSHTPIPLNHAVTIVISDVCLIISYTSGFVSFIPEQPQHPPLIG